IMVIGVMVTGAVAMAIMVMERQVTEGTGHITDNLFGQLHYSNNILHPLRMEWSETGHQIRKGKYLIETKKMLDHVKVPNLHKFRLI
ncbi:MAG: hypothetical protein ACXU9X_05735, partial [Thermodesulfobacteriota bacterium]